MDRAKGLHAHCFEDHRPKGVCIPSAHGGPDSRMATPGSSLARQPCAQVNLGASTRWRGSGRLEVGGEPAATALCSPSMGMGGLSWGAGGQGEHQGELVCTSQCGHYFQGPACKWGGHGVALVGPLLLPLRLTRHVYPGPSVWVCTTKRVVTLTRSAPRCCRAGLGAPDAGAPGGGVAPGQPACLPRGAGPISPLPRFSLLLCFAESVSPPSRAGSRYPGDCILKQLMLLKKKQTKTPLDLTCCRLVECGWGQPSLALPRPNQEQLGGSWAGATFWSPSPQAVTPPAPLFHHQRRTLPSTQDAGH